MTVQNIIHRMTIKVVWASLLVVFFWLDQANIVSGGDIEGNGRQGWYAFAFGGISSPKNSGLTGPFTDGTGNIIYDDGWNAGGGGGYDFGRLRAELDFSYRENNVVRIHDGVPGSFSIPGDKTSVKSAMLNLFWDMENTTRFTPYIGVGLGAALIDVDFGPKWESDDIVFAYQGSAGISLPVLTKLDLLVEYKFFGTEKAQLEGEGDGVRFNYNSHNINGGLRFRF